MALPVTPHTRAPHSLPTPTHGPALARNRFCFIKLKPRLCPLNKTRRKAVIPNPLTTEAIQAKKGAPAEYQALSPETETRDRDCVRTSLSGLSLLQLDGPVTRR